MSTIQSGDIFSNTDQYKFYDSASESDYYALSEPGEVFSDAPKISGLRDFRVLCLTSNSTPQRSSRPRLALQSILGGAGMVHLTYSHPSTITPTITVAACNYKCTGRSKPSLLPRSVRPLLALENELEYHRTVPSNVVRCIMQRRIYDVSGNNGGRAPLYPIVTPKTKVLSLSAQRCTNHLPKESI